ncbi:MAG: hypothetical protein KatS3mg105_1290 [Gemmatales bacterium]|nr:MAG: hypothetical protein KatS3mg105_1290 [Gemmatales bacterium]
MRRWHHACLAAWIVLYGSVAAHAAQQSAGIPKLNAAQLAKAIDQLIDKRLAQEKISPSPLADDAEFMRRAYLDITGVIPSWQKAAEFIDSQDPNKRARLIDELLADPKYGRHFADVWKQLTFPLTSTARRYPDEPYRQWLTAKFNANTPWDKMVYEWLTATGSQDKNGAVTYFLANGTIDQITDSVTKQFLGVQLQCAQCHNHPFTNWKRDEYWGMAAFFMKVRPERTKRGQTASVTEVSKGKPKLPVSAKQVPAKFLQGAEPKLDPNKPYRPVLAEWITSPNNPYFAKAMVNRMWGQFFGRGIVHPVDDMHEGNPPTNPELLTLLAEQFKANGFDLHYLIRAICQTKAYQRTSKPAGNNKDDKLFYSHMAVKVMTPEMLYDSLQSVMGNNRPPVNRGKKPRPGNSARDQFAIFFRTDEGIDPTEYSAGIPQALRLMNSGELNRNSAMLDEILKSTSEPAEVLDRLFLGTLSRRPTANEKQKFLGYIEQKADNARDGYRDVLWVLLNTSEFTLNH